MSERILFVHPAPSPYRIDLFNALAHALPAHFLFSREDAPGHSYWKDSKFLDQAEFPMDFLVGGGTYAGKTLRPNLSSLLERCDPAVIVTSEFGFQTLQCLFYRFRHPGTGLVVMSDLNSRAAEKLGRLHAFMRGFVLRTADAIIASSSAGARLFMEKLHDESAVFRALILRNEGVFQHQLEACSKKKDELDALHRLEGRPVVLSVARLEKGKGGDKCLRAFAEACKETSFNAVLIMVGDGGERRPLEALAGHLGIADRVIFTGFVDPVDLCAYYLLADLFLFLSDIDVFGAVVNESLLAGVPVICSSAVGASDLVREGENGRMVDPSGVSQVGACIVALVEDVRRHKRRPRVSLMHDSFSDQLQAVLDAVGSARERAAVRLARRRP